MARGEVKVSDYFCALLNIELLVVYWCIICLLHKGSTSSLFNLCAKCSLFYSCSLRTLLLLLLATEITFIAAIDMLLLLHY